MVKVLCYIGAVAMAAQAVRVYYGAGTGAWQEVVFCVVVSLLCLAAVRHSNKHTK